MCGIAAILRATSPELISRLRTMTDMIRHRGPDDEGFLVGAPLSGKDTPRAVYESSYPYNPKKAWDGSVSDGVRHALGHRRLSIVDLSAAGHQPMSYAGGRYWIVYNGEVYNHIELREELERLGHRFVSRTDTEVILASYAQWGEACLSRFNGMWAFVLLDLQSKTAFLARDRFGVKPLYYRVSSDGSIAVASEIKQFTALPDWNPKANPQRCYDFLVRGITDHSEQTLFEGVDQIRGGWCLTLGLDSNDPPKPKPWYSLPESEQIISETEAADKFRELLTDSVRLRLRADVKVGSCLSGGLDSSSIVCLMNRQLRSLGRAELQETVSSCFDIARFDERPFIEAVARHTQIKTHLVFPDYRELFAVLPNILRHQDEPFPGTSIVAQWDVFSEARRQGLIVMLDGQGSDEYLAGYHGFFAAHFAQLFKRLRWGLLRGEIKAWRRRHGYSNTYAVKLLADQMLPGWMRGAALAAIGRSLQPDWLLVKDVDASDRERTRSDLRGSIRNMSRSKLVHTTLPQLLHFEDRNSMAHSIEARVPFLDYRLVEHVFTLPDRFKIHDGETKHVLRQALKEILPEEVRTRQDKMGFMTPEEVWVKEVATTEFRAAFAQACDRLSDWIDPNRAKNHLEQVIAGARPFTPTPWRIICLGAWKQAFNV